MNALEAHDDLRMARVMLIGYADREARAQMLGELVEQAMGVDAAARLRGLAQLEQ